MFGFCAKALIISNKKINDISKTIKSPVKSPC